MSSSDYNIVSSSERSYGFEQFLTAILTLATLVQNINFYCTISKMAYV